ncbi:flavodoxin [Enterocloster lavalensis]|uniref:flavodoxin n=1 Tax=Enterocloster lavalensis TaxID=460384 RepID=UPI001D0626CC|nr:flavodoxin [Enterocloster lavalensis]MBS5606054.1 flavodoxin [Enterocloster asparagiformis]MCB6344090.1 flavodoxin [Enterocloster lavalensis]
MDKIYVVYWSQTGNTEVMAEAVSQGIRESGKEAETLTVSQITADTLKEAQAFALGCPAMGDEVLEESEMEPFMEQLDPMISGKQIGLFGSYGWGDGQWMREWQDRVMADGAVVAGGEGIIAQEMPDEDVLAACRNLGRILATV